MTTPIPVSRPHRPQIHTRFPKDVPWLREGNYARHPLWPHAGDAGSFALQEWTAYYRAEEAEGGAADLSAAVDSALAFFQIFVCCGELQLADPEAPDVAPRTLRVGTFFCGVLSAKVLAAAARSADCLLIVKRSGTLPQSPKLRFRVRDTYEFLPNLGSDGVVDAYGSAYVLGNPLQPGPGSTALVRFPEGATVSSHHHPAPIFHEFIYLAGGHQTPDGFYAPGDHVRSLPGCKEGPWLACHHPDPERYPAAWPRYVAESEISPAAALPPFDNPLRDETGDVFGLLFVHGGPFVLGSGELNWSKLTPHEPGPMG